MNIVLYVLLVVGLGVLLFGLSTLAIWLVRDVPKVINKKLAEPIETEPKQEVVDTPIGTRVEMAEAMVENKGLSHKLEATRRDIDKYSRLLWDASQADDTEAIDKFVKELDRLKTIYRNLTTQININNHIIDNIEERMELEKNFQKSEDRPLTNQEHPV